MKNAAGDKNADEYIKKELERAGITVYTNLEIIPHPEIFTHHYGQVHIPGGTWKFNRCWYYWSCCGPALPLKYAKPLWNMARGSVRAGGDCALREPKGHGYPSTDCYHIDTQAGLGLFAAILYHWGERTLTEREADAKSKRGKGEGDE
jgi:hypothetical protein